MKIRFLPTLTVVMLMVFGFKTYDLATAVAQDNTVTAEKLNDIPTAAGQEEQPVEETAQEGDVAPEEDLMADEMLSPTEWSPTEIQVLQDLSQRRQELQQRASELDIREKLLKATENRIDTKITSLKKIEAQIQALLKIHDEKEQAQLESLVKTYSSMKAKDAARIFSQLDMDILISIIEKMSEKKVAPIMANMSADSAKRLTVELATRKKLPNIEG